MSDPVKRRGISPRGWGVVLMAVVCFMRAWSYLEPGLTAPPNQLAFISEFIPVTTYAFMWLGAGVILFSALFIRRALPWGMGLFAGMHLMWSLSFTASWLILDSPRAWVSAISYVGLAGMSLVIARMIDPQDIMTPWERSTARARARIRLFRGDR